MRLYSISLLCILACNFARSQGLFLNGNVRMVTTTGSFIVVDGAAGNITLGTGANFNPIALDNSGEIHLDANWVNNSGNVGFAQEGATVRMTGANQTIGGSTSTTFHRLFLEGTNTKQLLIHTRVGGIFQNLNGLLSVGDRVLDLNNFQLIITNSASTALTSGSGYILSETNAGYNKGVVRWKSVTANGTYTFPFGVNGVKIPLVFTKTSGSGDVAVSTRATNASNNLPWANVPSTGQAVAHMASAVLGATDASVPAVIDRWWDISTTATMQANVTFNYRLIENTTNYAAPDFGSQHWRANAWQEPVGGGNVNPDGVTGYVSVSGMTNFTPINTTPIFEQDQTYFSPYVLAPIIFPLPSTVDYFRGGCEGNFNEIEWRAAKLASTDYYVLEKSLNGSNWEEIEQIKPLGEVDQMMSYAYTDMSNRGGATYYRLLEVNYSGAANQLGVIDVTCSSLENAISVYPNPSNGQFVVEISSDSDLGEREFVLTDLGGKVVESRIVNVQSGINQFHYSGNYVTGMYLLYLNGNTTTFDIQKVIIKN